MWDRRARYIGNHDGDSVKMIVDQGFNDTKEFDVHLLGVYAPELSTPEGEDCREFVLFWFNQNSGRTTNKWPFVVITARMKRTDREQKTLDRYVATVTNFDGSRNLNAEIGEYIHSKGYSGGIGA